jgi:superfamily II DNA or RNA helicase
MKGLYLLTTRQLEKDKTIKFGMSMRIEYRWIDYLAIFSDAKYLYYYEFLDDLEREEILNIENKILKIHKDERNDFYQTEYFYCDDYNKFHKSIIDILNQKNIKYNFYNNHNFNKKNYDYKHESLIDFKEIIEPVNITPREDQKIIIKKSCDYFKENDKGILILMCGVGKTLISLWIIQMLNSSNIIIGVPNKLLLNQWKLEIEKIFTNTYILLVKDRVKESHIENFIKNNKNNKDNKKNIIITTYSSCYKVLSVSNNLNINFDMKINDECHHLTTSNVTEDDTKKFTNMLDIKSHKQLSLTATIKNLDTSSNDLSIISNDDEKYFGKIIDKKCLLWAINEKIICDYVIQTIITDIEQLDSYFNKFDINDDNDKRLFLSAYASLKSIDSKNSHHLLIYCNNQENSKKIINYIKLLIDNKYFIFDNLYFSHYISDMPTKKQIDIIDKFKQASYGIITCVYCLGEGWDFPILDGVVIAENMTANIRIVQSTLRASRKNKQEPNKITKIILPILNYDDWLNNDNNDDLKKVREVIYQMGLEDETIMTKIKVYKMPINMNNINDTSKKNNEIINYYDENNELTELLKLKTIPRHALDITYEKAKKIIQEKNIIIKSKDEYYQLCDKDIRLPKNPEERFKGKFDWIEYLNIQKNYYEIDVCKKMIEKYLKEDSEIKKDNLNLSLVCDKLCKLDDKFPPNGLWTEYYKAKQLSDIINISNVYKSKGLSNI